MSEASCNQFEVTPEELECVELIARRLIPPRVFRMLGQIPTKYRRGEKIWNGYIVPERIYSPCNNCNEPNTMNFTPTSEDPTLQCVAGQLECGNCKNVSSVWLMEPQEIRDARVIRWGEIWISPPLRDEQVELPPEVDEDFRNDFKQAVLNLSFSPRGSVGLSRYCLQKLIHRKAGIKKENLGKEIDALIESNNLPEYLKTEIDAIRGVGTFGSHPMEDKGTGEIVEVNVAEAEWLLEILRNLFDFYFVAPIRSQKRKDEFNKKIDAVGKKPIQ